MTTTLANSPEVAAERQATYAAVRDAQRIALETFIERYAWVERGEQFVGTPENRVPASLAVENTLRALWKNGDK